MGLIPGTAEPFTIAAYDGANGGGNLLSTGSLVETIVPGLNIFAVTLDGVPASIQLALQDTAPAAGTATTERLTVMASDADGNVIVGGGPYEQPIALSSSDASGIVTVSPATVTKPDQKVTLTYSGGSIEGATISASASGVSPANVSGVTFAPAPTAVADYQVQPAVRHAAPHALRRKPRVLVEQDPTAIVAGPDGNLWLAVTDSVSGIVALAPSGSQQSFPGGTNGLPSESITGLAVSGDAKVWYVGGSDVGYIDPATHAIADFPLSTAGGSTPLCASYTGVNVVAAPPSDSGSVWITMSCASGGSQLAHVTHGGTITPYDLTGFVAPQGIAVGKDGDLYIAGQDATTADGEVAQVAIPGGVASAPSLLDVAAAPSLSLVGIAQSADGDFWVTTGSCAPSAFLRIHPAAGSIASWSAPSVFATSNCSRPYYLTALADGSLWAADHAFAGATRVTPGVYPAAPAQYHMLLPSPGSIQAAEWGVALGPDGDLYFTDAASTTTQPGDVVKVAY
jgi:sugar lactone lactonase YvrE